MLFTRILIAQDVIYKTPSSLFKSNSIFVGIGKSNQTTSNYDNSVFQIGVSKRLSISGKLNLRNEISFIKIPYTSRLSIGNYSDNLNYFELAAIPEFQLSNSVFIGAAPSLNYFLKSDWASFAHPTWRPLSIGGNSYVGIAWNDILLKIRYNLNTIDSNKTSSYFGFNIEYMFNL